MTDSDEEDARRKGSGDDGSPETVCDDVAEVVDNYGSVESFCVCRRGTKKTQSGHDLKTPKDLGRIRWNRVVVVYRRITFL